MLRRTCLSLGVLVLAGVFATPGQAAPRRCGTVRDAMPSACCQPIPPGAPDPYIPGALMRRTKTGVELRSCLMTPQGGAGAASITAVGTNFGLFTADTAGRQAALIAAPGQMNDTHQTVPGAAPGVLAFRAAVDETLTADMAQTLAPNVLVQMKLFGPDRSYRETISRIVLTTGTGR